MDILDILDKLFSSGYFEQLVAAEIINGRTLAIGNWIFASMLMVAIIVLVVVYWRKPNSMATSTFWTVTCALALAVFIMFAIGLGYWTSAEMWEIAPEAKFIDIYGGRIGNLLDIK